MYINLKLDKEYKPQELAVLNKGGKVLLISNTDNKLEIVKDITDFIKDKSLFCNRKSFPAVYDSKNEQLEIVRFIELQGKTSKSLLNSVVRVDQLINKTSLSTAVNEYGNMYSLYDFGTGMRKQSKKPIFGSELYMESLPQTYIVQLGDTLKLISELKKISISDLKKDNTFISNLKEDSEIKNSTLNLKHAAEANHLVLLAKNYTGYRNLMYLVSAAQVNREYGKPQLTWDELRKYSNNLIALSGTENSEFYRALINNDIEHAEKVAKELKAIFKQDFYISIFKKGKKYDSIIKLAKEIATKLDIKTVAVNDFKMLKQDQKEELKALQTIGTKKTLKQNLFNEPGENYYYHTSVEAEKEFSDDLASLDNTIEVYSKVDDFDILPHRLFNPKFPLPQGYQTQNQYFEFLVHQGFEIRLKQLGINKNTDKYQQYVDRLHHEMEVIESMNYAGYFIVVADFINYAKRNYDLYDDETAARWKAFAKEHGYSTHQPIAIGYGRGSAAGSLVSYSMFITEVDPIPYDLLFERFLNKDRAGMPDIDTDIPDNKRPEVLDYVTTFYNFNDPEYLKIAKNDPSDLKQLKSHVAGIIVFLTLKGKQALRDVTRIYGEPVSVGDKLANLFNDSGEKNLSSALKNENEFSAYLTSHPQYQKIVNMAIKLEGLEKSEGQHACGKVITPDPVTTYLPVTYLKLADGSGKYGILTQVTNVEDFGLLKMDFLGLRTMNVLDTSLNEINAEIKKYNEKNENKKLYINQHSILHKAIIDIDTYKFMRAGHTFGVFQFASRGMTDLVHRMFADIEKLPKNENTGRELFDRLSAATALYRPGPMQFIDTYLDNMKTGQISYQLPQLESILKETYGVTVYQEQVMMITRKIAGFSLNDADHVRKAMGHKIPAIMAEYKDYFLHGSKEKNIDGAVKHSHITEEQAAKLWDTMETFASYGFNKSHAVSYTYLSVIEAYLSLHYPEEFYTAQLNTLAGNADKVSEALGHIYDRKITILPASVNESQEYFTVARNSMSTNKAIRFGLKGIKRMGKKSTAIIKDRQKYGRYQSLFDFINRQNEINNFNKTAYEALTYSGAFDEFFGSRTSKIKQEQKIISLIKSDSIFLLNSQSNALKHLISLSDNSISTSELIKEKEYTGYFISDNPLNKYQELLKNNHDYITLKEIDNLNSGDIVNSLVYIDEVKPIMTKSGNMMAVINAEDMSGTARFTIFSNQYEIDKNNLSENKIVALNYAVKISDDYGKTLQILNATPAEYLLNTVNPTKITYILSENKDEAQKQLKNVLQINEDNQLEGIKVPCEYRLGYHGRAFNRTKAISNLSLDLNLDTYFKLENYLGRHNINVSYQKQK